MNITPAAPIAALIKKMQAGDRDDVFTGEECKLVISFYAELAMNNWAAGFEQAVMLMQDERSS